MRAGSFNELGVVMRKGMPIRRRKTSLPTAEGAQTTLGLSNGNFDLKIALNQLKISANIGVYDYELNNPRPLIIDVEVGLRPNLEIEDDSLKNTIDYDFLAQSAINLANSKHFNLVETYAQELAKILIQELKIHSINMKIEKPDAVSGSLSSSVCLNWKRI